MAYTFRVKPHQGLTGYEMIELWRDGELVAGIYPQDDGILVVSKYMTHVEHEKGEPPSALIHLGKQR